MENRRHILHYRTNTNGNVPIKENLEVGEIAINTYGGSEKLFIKNTNDDIVSFTTEKDVFFNVNYPLISKSLSDESGVETTETTSTLVKLSDFLIQSPCVLKTITINSITVGNENLVLGLYQSIGDKWVQTHISSNKIVNGKNVLSLVCTDKRYEVINYVSNLLLVLIDSTLESSDEHIDAITATLQVNKTIENRSNSYTLISYTTEDMVNDKYVWDIVVGVRSLQETIRNTSSGKIYWGEF